MFSLDALTTFIMSTASSSFVWCAYVISYNHIILHPRNVYVIRDSSNSSSTHLLHPAPRRRFTFLGFQHVNSRIWKMKIKNAKWKMRKWIEMYTFLNSPDHEMELKWNEMKWNWNEMKCMDWIIRARPLIDTWQSWIIMSIHYDARARHIDHDKRVAFIYSSIEHGQWFDFETMQFQDLVCRPSPALSPSSCLFWSISNSTMRLESRRWKWKCGMQMQMQMQMRITITKYNYEIQLRNTKWFHMSTRRRASRSSWSNCCNCLIS
jgi:hypothetical protein